MPSLLFGISKVEISEDGTTWTDLGATKGGVEFTQDIEEREIMSDQSTDPVAVITTRAPKTLTINLLDATPNNLALAFGGTVSSNTVTIPAIVTGVEKQIKITTQQINNEKYVITIKRAKITGKSSIRLNSDDAATVPLDVKVLAPTTGDPVTIEKQAS